MITGTAGRWALLIALGLHALCVAPAFASLGGDIASVLADRADPNDAVSLQSLQECDIREIDSTNGMRIREFLSRGGTVFAVAWSGPAPVDLRQLLGAHFAAYGSALAQLKSPGGQRTGNLNTPTLVVETGGHLRAYVGRAYLPAFIPSGMTAGDLH